MSGLGQFQAAMAAALLAPAGDAVPDGWDAGAARRFRVYRNNVHHGLAAALAHAYPVVERLVGAAFFTAMARAFLVAHPPRTRSLALFGDGFADFVEGFAPASSLPYLADVARLERAVLEAQHATDAAPLSYTAVLAIEARAQHIPVTPHPATRLVASPHPIVALWRADGPTTILARPEPALVTRPAERVVVQALEPAAAAFARAVLDGQPVDHSLATARQLEPDFDAVAGWQPLIAGGALAAPAEPFA